MLSIGNLSGIGFGPIDLKLASGRAAAVHGPSGSGKTLFLRAIADLDPNRGRVLLDGEDRDGMPAPTWRRRVSYVAAETGWWTERVGDHFDDPAAAIRLLEALGLGEAVLDWSVPRLSTGEKQRLGLARALAGGPRVLLLDEPTSALDEDNTHAVEALLRRRLDDATAILIVTHDPEQARRLQADPLYMRDGRLRETGP